MVLTAIVQKPLLKKVHLSVFMTKVRFESYVKVEKLLNYEGLEINFTFNVLTS